MSHTSSQFLGCCGVLQIYFNVGTPKTEDMEAVDRSVLQGRYGLAVCHLTSWQKRFAGQLLLDNGWVHVATSKNPKTNHVLYTYTKTYRQAGVRNRPRAFGS